MAITWPVAVVLCTMIVCISAVGAIVVVLMWLDPHNDEEK